MLNIALWCCTVKRKNSAEVLNSFNYQNVRIIGYGHFPTWFWHTKWGVAEKLHINVTVFSWTRWILHYVRDIICLLTYQFYAYFTILMLIWLWFSDEFQVPCWRVNWQYWMSHGRNFYGSKRNFIAVRWQQLSLLLCSDRFFMSPFFSVVHILLIIRNQIPGSSLFPDTNISYRNFPLFSSFPLGHDIILLKIKPRELASSLVFNSQFSSHHIIQR